MVTNSINTVVTCVFQYSTTDNKVLRQCEHTQLHIYVYNKLLWLLHASRNMHVAKKYSQTNLFQHTTCSANMLTHKIDSGGAADWQTIMLTSR